jgi:hypothetical protein
LDRNFSDASRRHTECDSIETDESDLPSVKQEESRIATVREMAIDARDESENAFGSIRRNNEPDAIETDESDMQPLKHEKPRISTIQGI